MKIPTPDDLRARERKAPETREPFTARCVRLLKSHTSTGASPSIPPHVSEAEVDETIKELEAAKWDCKLHTPKTKRGWRTLVITERK